MIELTQRQERYYSNLQRNILAAEQIKEIQKNLDRGGVEFILLKGLALAVGLYNDLAARYSMDIDLLVRKTDLPKLKERLENLGYQLTSPQRAKLLEDFGCGEWVFIREGFLPLDIHWQLCQYERFKGIIRFDEEEIFRRAADINLEGVRVKTLSDEDLFLYLAMHFGLVHNFSGPNWLYDLKLFLDKRKDNLDWELLDRKAGQANLRKVLQRVLVLARQAEPLADLKPAIRRRSYIAQALLVDGFLNTLRVFYRMLFPSRAWLQFHYGDSNLPHRLQHFLR
ncbi:MAG: nucleotidyltransferase domain-containing protein, partial [Candidatus Omnitrophota bacterium]